MSKKWTATHLIRLEWVASEPTPYTNLLYNAISRQAGVSIHVSYLTATGKGVHPWTRLGQMDFDHAVVPTAAALAWRVMQAREALFVVAGWGDLSTQLALLLLMMLRRKYFVWTDTPVVKKGTIRSSLRAAFLQMVFRRAEGVFATGELGRRRLVEMGAPPERAYNLPFFVSLPPVVSRDPSSRRRLMSAGRLNNEIKAYDVAVRALSRVTSQFGVTDVEYVIAGSGEDEGTLRDLVRSLGLEDCVRILGWTEPEEVWKLRETASIFVHPAKVDPFPVAILEAMAAGQCVCASRACGSAVDRIKSGQNGLIHETGDVDALTRDLVTLLTMPDGQFESICRAARATAEEWPVSRGVGMLMDLFTKTCATRSGVDAR